MSTLCLIIHPSAQPSKPKRKEGFRPASLVAGLQPCLDHFISHHCTEPHLHVQVRGWVRHIAISLRSLSLADLDGPVECTITPFHFLFFFYFAICLVSFSPAWTSSKKSLETSLSDTVICAERPPAPKHT